jgi:hypothetical protein
MAIDLNKQKANLALIKTALRKAAIKGKDGNPIRVGFAFAPGKDRKDHLLLVDPRKRAQMLMQQIGKEHKERKILCCGTAAVIKVGSKLTFSIKFIKKLAGGERKIEEAFKALSLTQYKVVLEKVKDDEEVEDVVETDDKDLDLRAGADDDDEAPADEEEEEGATADASDDEEEGAAADASDDEEEEEEPEDEKVEANASDDDDEEDDDEEEEGDEEEEEAPAEAKTAPMAPAKLAALGAAPKVYRDTHAVIGKQIDKLKDAIKQAYKSEAPELIAEIDKGLAQMDSAISSFDHSIADEMDKAHKAKDEATRHAHLEKCRALHAKNIRTLASNPMLKHIENNPFGVQIAVMKTYALSFKHIEGVLKK